MPVWLGVAVCDLVTTLEALCVVLPDWVRDEVRVGLIVSVAVVVCVEDSVLERVTVWLELPVLVGETNGKG